MRSILFICFFSISLFGFSQELNCNVVVNAQLTGNEDQQIFTTLEKELTEFVNDTKWTNKTFAPQEIINCSMVINITERRGDGFRASIQVQASRPVYGSTYTTPTYNINDKDFNFQYLEFQNLIYSPTQFESNLVSVIAFHVYMILGFDADSFARNGGDDYFKQAQTIANYSQASNAKGWRAEDGLQSRYILAKDIVNQNFAALRQSFYKYHLEGLDTMSENPKEAKSSIIKALQLLRKTNDSRPNSYLMRVFFDAKADEIAQIFSDGPQVEVSQLIQLLQRVAPLHATKWRTIKF